MERELHRLESKKAVQNNPFYLSLSKASSIRFAKVRKESFNDTPKNPFEKDTVLHFDKNALQSSQSSMKNSSVGSFYLILKSHNNQM